ncbi:MAG: hypothetical protein H6621_04770 [Halobacteriovoraceae bacterium]|nr:hypothetical protein [Halobacteriovoraceae bacterium]
MKKTLLILVLFSTQLLAQNQTTNNGVEKLLIHTYEGNSELPDARNLYFRIDEETGKAFVSAKDIYFEDEGRNEEILRNLIDDKIAIDSSNRILYVSNKTDKKIPCAYQKQTYTFNFLKMKSVESGYFFKNISENCYLETEKVFTETDLGKHISRTMQVNLYLVVVTDKNQQIAKPKNNCEIAVTSRGPYCGSISGTEIFKFAYAAQDLVACRKEAQTTYLLSEGSYLKNGGRICGDVKKVKFTFTDSKTKQTTNATYKKERETNPYIDLRNF